MFTYVIYALAIIGLILSFIKDKKKTKMALKKAWKSFENILPQFLCVILVIGIMLSVIDEETIVAIMGSNSGMVGIFIACVIGSITLMPGFVAFPLAAALLGSGAGIAQIAGFVSALMMVGIVTMPLEIKTFGKKVAIIRNTLSFVFSFIVALIMQGVLG